MLFRIRQLWRVFRYPSTFDVYINIWRVSVNVWRVIQYPSTFGVYLSTFGVYPSTCGVLLGIRQHLACGSASVNIWRVVRRSSSCGVHPSKICVSSNIWRVSVNIWCGTFNIWGVSVSIWRISVNIWRVVSILRWVQVRGGRRAERHPAGVYPSTFGVYSSTFGVLSTFGVWLGAGTRWEAGGATPHQRTTPLLTKGRLRGLGFLEFSRVT